MTNHKIIIRADGNARIGAGHLMRCLTIADAWQDKEEILFVCADEDSAVLVRERGYEAKVLSTDMTCMESELPLWGELFAKRRDRVILVDNYCITNHYLEELQQYGKVIVLEDMGKAFRHTDGIINYNVFADRAMYRTAGSEEILCYVGGKYVPIRPEFCDRKYEVKENAEHILITTGGGDMENIAGQILERIRSERCCYHLVTGRFNPHYDALLAYAEKYSNVHIYHDVKDMAELMLKCDLAITAGGTTVYELSSLGVPFVCFSYAENQEKLTEYIGRNQIAGYAGAYHKMPEQMLDGIQEQAQCLVEDFGLRQRYHIEEKQMVDGQGASRIAGILREQLLL